MPRTMTELFNGGVVTARIGALLESGELQRADDCVYREKDPAIWRAPGRTALNSTALGSPSAVKGITHCSYERTRTDQLIAHVGSTLYRSPLAATTPPTLDALSFSEVGTPGQVTGTVSATTTFTAASGYPFLVDVIGAAVAGPSGNIGYVSGVSGQDGTTGHYNIVTLSAATTNGSVSLSFEYGCVHNLSNTGDETLESVQYGTAYLSWFGKGLPRRLSWRGRRSISGVAYDDVLVSRPIGLDALRTAPTISVVANAVYAWNAILGTGYYWFLITEVFAPGGDVTAAEKDSNLASEIVEAAYLAPDPTSSDPNSAVGRPIPVNITATTGFGVQIVFPAVTNNGINGRLANNWAVYMYGPTSDPATAPSLAQFRRVAVYPITQYTAGYTRVLYQTIVPMQRAFPTTHAADDGQSEFENAGFLTGASDRQVGFAKSGSSTDSPGVQNAVDKLGGWVVPETGLGFSTSGVYATATICGIAVVVTGSADTSGNAGTKAGYYIHVDTPSKHMLQNIISEFGSYGSITHGGALDTLGVAWALADLATITVTVGKTGTGSRQRLAIDSVELKVYFNAGTINFNGPAYRVVTYRDQIGLTVSDPSNLPPPECSTGDFFQGMLVLNDLSDETAIRFSLPGRPEAFPQPYVMRFNATKRHDRVTLIRTLGQSLIIGLENSIERVNYLPRETNTDLNDGLAHEALATDHGIPGPFCAVTFDMPGKGIMLAYVSSAGIFISNGIWTIPLNLDLDWNNTVKLSALSTAVLRVYPREKWLALYYCPAGATHNKNTRVLYFCYQSDKLKSEYSLPAVGPCVVSARSACEVFIRGRSYLLTGHETDGKVYWEDNGMTVPPGYRVRLTDDTADGDGKTTTNVDVKIIPVIRSRKFYPITLDRDGYGEKVYLLFSAYGSNSITASSTTTVGNTTITSTAAFGSVIPGMRVLGSGIDPGTIVLSKSDSSTIVVSRAPNASATSVTLTFDTGTLGITIRGSNLGEAVKGLRTDYVSTLVGDLVSVVNSNIRRGFELQVEKVPLTFDSNGDAATWADLGMNMRLHTITYVVSDSGLPDSNRNSA